MKIAKQKIYIIMKKQKKKMKIMISHKSEDRFINKYSIQYTKYLLFYIWSKMILFRQTKVI